MPVFRLFDEEVRVFWEHPGREGRVAFAFPDVISIFPGVGEDGLLKFLANVLFLQREPITPEVLDGFFECTIAGIELAPLGAQVVQSRPKNG